MSRIGLIITISLFYLNVFAQKPVANSTAKLSKTDSIQYILGAHIGQYIVSNGFNIDNPTMFKKGMDDVILGKSMLVSPDSIPSLMKKYQNLSAEERGKRQEKALFESVKSQPGVGVLPSGVCYSIVKAGDGKRPQLADSVILHLKGYLADGTLFEDTYPKNAPYKTSPSGVIPGMKEILQIMPVGSLWRIYIPASLGFADKGLTGLIPPYSALIYELELLSVQEMLQPK